MEYTLQLPAQGAFALPTAVVEQHLKFANELCIKAILWLYCKQPTQLNPAVLAAGLGCSEPDANDALAYWAAAGLLAATQPVAVPAAAPRRAVRAEVIKPTRAEVARRGLESPEVAFLLQEAQLKFGRALRQNESSTLVWLHDDEGLDISIILMLLEFAGKQNKLNIGFIERTAISWINNGIDTVQAAEAHIVTTQQSHAAWRMVESVMGIEHRSPSEKELKLAHTWVNEWGYSRELLRAAYEKCVDTTSKFSIPYIKKILDSWHKSGVRTVDDLADPGQKPAAVTGSSYDLALEEQIMFEDEV